MAEVILLHYNAHIAASLRAIAERLDSGEIVADSATLIIPPETYHFGTANDKRSTNDAVFNCTYAIHRLMEAATDD